MLARRFKLTRPLPNPVLHEERNVTNLLSPANIQTLWNNRSYAAKCAVIDTVFRLSGRLSESLPDDESLPELARYVQTAVGYAEVRGEACSSLPVPTTRATEATTAS